MSRTPSPPAIERWFRGELDRLGLGDTGGRYPLAWWRLFRLLAVNPGLRLEDLEMVDVSNPDWIDAKCRTPRERLGMKLGNYNFPSKPSRRLLIALPRKTRRGRIF